MAVLWAVLFCVVVAGLIMYVVAIIGWQQSSWKWVLLVVGILLPIIGAIAGWASLFAGRLRDRR